MAIKKEEIPPFLERAIKSLEHRVDSEIRLKYKCNGEPLHVQLDRYLLEIPGCVDDMSTLTAFGRTVLDSVYGLNREAGWEVSLYTSTFLFEVIGNRFVFE